MYYSIFARSISSVAKGYGAVSGYTTTYHIDTIKALIANSHFDEPAGIMSLSLAINDLKVHFQYGHIGKEEYNNLIEILQTKKKQFATK